MFRAACEALANLDVRPELGNVTRRRRRCPRTGGRPRACFEIIPGCAHVPQLQSPRLLLEMIGDVRDQRSNRVSPAPAAL